MLAKIVQAGEPVLRRPARNLSADELRSPAVGQLIELMRETMRDAPGVGLAAPQVGESLQLCVIEDRAEFMEGLPPEELAVRGREPLPFHVLANPRLSVEDPTPATFFEGCLSVEGMVALVPRATVVRVEALDHRGEPVSIRARGWYARILQHEIDHLGGSLYIDRMESRSFMTATNHSRYWRGRSVAEVQTTLRIDTPRKG